MYSHVACDVMKERTLYLLKPSSLIWHLMPYLFLFSLGTRLRIDLCKKSDRTRCLAVSILEYNINSNSKSAERAKAFWFSEGRTK